MELQMFQTIIAVERKGAKFENLDANFEGNLKVLSRMWC